MGAGRPRKPRIIKFRQGTLRPGREARHPPDPQKISEVPSPPARLRPYAKAKWKEIAPELISQGLLTTLDLGALEICCAAFALYLECQDAIYHWPRKKRGARSKPRTMAEYMNGRNSQTMPELATMKSAWQTHKSYLTEFGLSPSSRGKIETKPPAEGDQDTMRDLINGA